MDKTRSKKLLLNSSSSLINQIITLVCGFVLPKLILGHFGSDVNGLVNSINQFLSLITFLDLGVGTVVTSTLYKPLAECNEDEISRIYVSAKRFFRNIALIYLAYLVIISYVYPVYISTGFDKLYVVTLILAISITLFAQYYFGIVNQLLLNADQKSYIPLVIQSLTLIINTFACTILIHFGASIQVVKFSTSLIFLARPLFLSLYVKKHYKINVKIKIQEEPIKQKWNGLAQHLSYVVLSNTDTVVLTLFSSLANVSIYGVYHLVVNGIKTLCQSLTTGITALLGNMLAKNEKELLNSVFSEMEWLIHTSVTLFFTICGILIVPFVRVYTLGVNDANYEMPLFGFLITAAQAAFCLRLPYNMIVLAAGHYKQTQTSSIIEMLLNIVISVLLVIKFGLVGVAIGTFVAMAYRTIYLVWYLKDNIINRSVKYFAKHIAVDGVSLIVMAVGTCWISMSEVSYRAWILMGIEVSVICVVVCLLVNMLFYRTETIQLLKKLIMRVRKK